MSDILLKAYRGDSVGWYVTKDDEKHGHGASIESALLDWHKKHGKGLGIKVPADDLIILLPTDSK